MTSTLLDQDLLKYNKLGLFPGPNEDEKDFLKRVHALLNYSYPMDKVCDESLSQAEELYDIKPNWVQVEYTDQGLKFWEAAGVEVSDKYFKFKLRKVFFSHQKYLGIYSKREILSHEFSHVGRMNFPPSAFEEIFAFQTSNSFRKSIGPLFSTPRESLSLAVISSMSFLSDFLLRQTPYAWAFFKLTPLLYLGYLVQKLFRAKRHYKRTIKKLKHLTQSSKEARYVAYRLTEQEIIKFSRTRLKKIQSYINDKKNKELRWRLIDKAYLQSS